MSARERVEYLDVAKGIGIILMILTHIYEFRINYRHILSFIYAFHMPMFFVISGYLFKLKNQESLPFITYFSKKAKSLIVPYIFYGLFFHIIGYANNYFENYIHCVKSLFSFNDNMCARSFSEASWFLTALFITDILYYSINKYFSTFIKILIIVGLTIFAAYNGKYSIIHLPFSANASLVGLSLFLLGNYVRYFEEKKKFFNKLFSLNIFLNLLLLIVIYKSSNLNGLIDMRVNKYGSFPLFWLNLCLSYIMIINFSKQLLKVLRFLKFKILFDWIVYIGRNSIVYVCTNLFFLFYLKQGLFVNPLFNYPIILRLISVLLLITITSYIITNTRLRFLLGGYRSASKICINFRTLRYLMWKKTILNKIKTGLD